MVTTRPPKTIAKPTALGPVANTDTKLLIYGLFQKGRVLAQDGDAWIENVIRDAEIQIWLWSAKKKIAYRWIDFLRSTGGVSPSSARNSSGA